VDDHQEQEYEFWRRLEEEQVDRRKLLKRGLAAGAGLMIFSFSDVALATRQRVLADPPLRGRAVSVKEMIAEAKKEGRLNTIALPHDWANYGQILSTFKKKYGLSLDEQNPNGSSAEENQAVRSLKGDPRAPDVLDVGPSFAIDGANEGLYAKHFTRAFAKVPRAMKDTRGFWLGDYWGVISFGVNGNVVSTVPRSWAD
jgi:putative spermidine/putrescine transport system substrate-binding protein